MTDAHKKTCTNFTPAGFWSHWKEWHRGHGCDLDDGKEPPPDDYWTKDRHR